MRILFVCKYNRFRSKVAEAYFNHFNKNTNYEARSAGIILDLHRTFMSSVVRDILASERVKVLNEQSQKVNQRLFSWADKIIIVADDIPLEGFPVEKIEIWPIADASESRILDIRARMDEIKDKVEDFVRSINI